MWRHRSSRKSDSQGGGSENAGRFPDGLIRVPRAGARCARESRGQAPPVRAALVRLRKLLGLFEQLRWELLRGIEKPGANQPVVFVDLEDDVPGRRRLILFVAPGALVSCPQVDRVVPWVAGAAPLPPEGCEDVEGVHLDPHDRVHDSGVGCLRRGLGAVAGSSFGRRGRASG